MAGQDIAAASNHAPNIGVLSADGVNKNIADGSREGDDQTKGYPEISIPESTSNKGSELIFIQQAASNTTNSRRGSAMV